MPVKPVWFWVDVFPLVVAFCRREHVNFNSVINLAVQSFLGQCSVDELRLRARLAALLKEEAGLRKVGSCMLRSGSYLPNYAEKVLMGKQSRPEDTPFNYTRQGAVPLKALSKSEELTFRKICSRREMIAAEVARIQAELLKNVEAFRFEGEEAGDCGPECKSKLRLRNKKRKDVGGGE